MRSPCARARTSAPGKRCRAQKPMAQDLNRRRERPVVKEQGPSGKNRRSSRNTVTGSGRTGARTVPRSCACAHSLPMRARQSPGAIMHACSPLRPPQAQSPRPPSQAPQHRVARLWTMLMYGVVSLCRPLHPSSRRSRRRVSQLAHLPDPTGPGKAARRSLAQPPPAPRNPLAPLLLHPSSMN